MEYLIVANGPFIAKSILQEIAGNKILVALDGAADQLRERGMNPDIIIGDLDSIDDLAYYRQSYQPICWDPVNFKALSSLILSKKKLLIQATDQNNTDLQKAIQFCDQMSIKPEAIHIVCALGGRIDHEQSNQRDLRTFYQPHRPIFLHTEYQSLFFTSAIKNLQIKGLHQDYCGIFGSPWAKMNVHYGLVYDGALPASHDGYELFSSHDSSSNQIVGNRGALVDIEGHALIVQPPMFHAQRKFIAKSRCEQLQELLNDIHIAKSALL